ncbi:hypothetical protein BU26DRAFT_592206 [Trematosphaeria pertusa]|uniref:Uncharacterized protein n=1 Tax=Trematosphaeria pertusa TaxID=390896 RepID=A0A6A6IM20_9PLEO|nr:uncharacterized protein BU26DRAFT_592206 [Trematosphaeria pertusa]KAF2251118.1 hypothetical protein BU26DRAFT_592206 [Trematosphaeria pertusa]
MAPRSASAKPSQKASSIPSTVRLTRARRAASAQPISSSAPAKPIAKTSNAAFAVRSTRARRVASAQPLSSTSAGVPSYAKATISSKNKVVKKEEAKDTRSVYGDNHAAKEDRMMAEQANIALSKGLIDEEIFSNWSRPWHVKGEVEMKWSQGVLDKYQPEGLQPVMDIMDLKKAERIAAKKDAEEKKFLEQYFAGKIDMNGNPIQDEREKEKEQGSKKEAPKTKKAPAAKKTVLPIIIEEDSTTPAPEAKKKPSKLASVTPLSGLPSYAEYNYYQCAALCFERNLISGGNAEILRNRLIQDDINVTRNLPREAKPYSRETRRKRENQAPIVANAPTAPPAVFAGARKRKRGEDSEEDEEEKTGKKLKPT